MARCSTGCLTRSLCRRWPGLGILPRRSTTACSMPPPASWQPYSTLGPGSQNGPYASHGCIHVPLPAVRILFNWAPLGTPVVVYPGDGSLVADQVAQQSVDALGNPTSGVRGD